LDGFQPEAKLTLKVRRAPYRVRYIKSEWVAASYRRPHTGVHFDNLAKKLQLLLLGQEAGFMDACKQIGPCPTASEHQIVTLPFKRNWNNVNESISCNVTLFESRCQFLDRWNVVVDSILNNEEIGVI